MSSDKELRRHRIQVLFEVGKTASEIAKLTKEHPSFVYRWIKRFKEGEGVSDRPRSGRPKTIDEKVENKILAINAEKPDSSLRQIAARVEISKTSVRNVLKKKQLNYYVCPPKPKLTNQQKHKRVKFAKANKARDWKRVLFTDETTFELFGHHRKGVWVNNRSNVPSRPTVGHPVKLHAWAGISAQGKTKLVFYTGRLNANRYTGEILKHGLANKRTERLFGKLPWTFQHDGAPAHFAKSTNNWLKRSVPSFISSGKKGEWPAQSPDLNPIENLWAILKRRVQAANPQSLPQLKECLRQSWQTIDSNLLTNLVLSMPKRLNQVIDKNGEATKY